MRDLVERPVTFDYGYNMSCARCSGITALTSTEYHQELNCARVPCAHCKDEFTSVPLSWRCATPTTLF